MPNYMSELKKRGLTLRDFARRVGVSATYVSNVFKGSAVPSAATEKRIRDALAECPWCHNKWPEPLPKH